MRIQKIVNQDRRDFTAIYECEHCGHTVKGSGYDDSYFHRNVIPEKECDKCHRKAAGDYRPRAPKYSEGQTI